MILDAMLQRLYASLQRGPSLNARPHNSRQRIDLTQLDQLQSVSMDAVLPALLGQARKVSLPAKVPMFPRPDYPESEWSDEQKVHARQFEQQSKVIKKLHDIVIDAQEYYNDHGEGALFLGFPMLALPPSKDDTSFRSSRILAPLALVPITLSVSKGAKPSVTIKTAGEGADLLIPNPALLAWIEQQTGHEIPDLFEDDTGDNPEQEFGEILKFVTKALGMVSETDFRIETPLEPVPKAESLPDVPTILNGAIFGLFPLSNPGLLRDTKWMMEVENELQGPLTHYLCQAAIEAPPEGKDTLPPVLEQESTQEAKSFDSEYFIAPIDPSQTSTADSAREAKALVIHGPPGTGKSQTITNIIGDHLARGQRILFVCDKRTALDVVKHRLDHYGLGHLCGIIHDPTRDRRNLYMGLRDRMETLVESQALTDPSRALKQTNQRLAELNIELGNYFHLLHNQDTEDTSSFHELVGQWLAYNRSATDALATENLPELSIDLIDSHTTDIHEALYRSHEVHLASNPFFENITLSLDEFFKLSLTELRQKFTELQASANSVDEYSAEGLPPLDCDEPLAPQALMRERVSILLSTALQYGDTETCNSFAKTPLDTLSAWRKEWTNLSSLLPILEVDLDREWILLLSGKLPALGEASQKLNALEEYDATKGSLLRLLQFKKRGAAKEVLKALALSLSDENVQCGIQFFKGVRARWLFSDLCSRIRNTEIPEDHDIVLRPSVKTLQSCFEIIEAFGEKAETVTLYQQTHSALEAPETMRSAAELLHVSAERATKIELFINEIHEKRIFKDTYINFIDEGLRQNTSAVPITTTWIDNTSTMEGVIRLENSLSQMPVNFRSAVRTLALAEVTAEQAEVDLKCKASQNAIHAFIEQHPEIMQIDTARINAAFDEYGRRVNEKMDLVREYVTYR